MRLGFTNTILLFYTRFFIIVLLCFCTTVTKAQLCNGSLGDPVVNINFGTGNGSGFAATNGYIYTSSSCPNDGYYTVTNSTSGCFGNSWLSVAADHTGGGGFMLVNASYTPGDFFLTTVTDLCPNTTYEFAAWMMNVLARSGIKPNITFSIETTTGTVLQQYATGDIPESFSASWKQYGFYFTTPVNNPVIVLRMTNNAPGGIGNDIALDDITFRPCGPAVITAAIQNNSDTINICEGNTNQYTFTGAVSVGYTLPVYQWQVSTDAGVKWSDITNANTLFYQRMPTNAGSYWYRLSVTEKTALSFTACRIASNIVAVNVHAKPFVNAGSNKILFFKDSVVLDAVITGENPVYYWDPPNYLNNINLLTPAASPPADMSYTVFATSKYGCTNKDDVFIKVVAGIFVPTAFTPNGDGKNDNWRIPFLDPLFGAVVNVYNRFGQLVYHAKGKIVDWDGNLNGLQQPTGAYVYHIRFKKSQQQVNMKGTLILIR